MGIAQLAWEPTRGFAAKPPAVSEVLLFFGTPRKPPKASRLVGRVVVLDIAFAGQAGAEFEQVTLPLIEGLGDRLVAWIDHHDHERHADYRSDPRFVLARKVEHGACPEMITPELVARFGAVDTVLCHTDFDGLVSAAKWLRAGIEPYVGCDDDARAIDTRMGEPSERARVIDRAIRARPGNHGLMTSVVRFLASGMADTEAQAVILAAAVELEPIERETERAARGYRLLSRRQGGTAAYVDVSSGFGKLDKTDLLLRGQKQGDIAIVVDQQNIAVAAPFDSGIDFLSLLGLAGGMPTRVSLPRKQLHDVLDRLGVDFV
jgi:hypothetical protein